jgi:hypothetical protein
VLDRFDARGRKIDDHVARPEIGGQGLEPRDIDFELIAPLVRRDIHRH